MTKMIIKDKNKLKLKSGSKILVLGLVSIILFNFLAPLHFSLAVGATGTWSTGASGTWEDTAKDVSIPLGTCREGTGGAPEEMTQKECEDRNANKSSDDKKWIWVSYYYTLAPLPDPNNEGRSFSTFDPTQTSNLSVYLNLMIKLFIGICAVLAVIMIVMGGIEYMTSELPGLKSDGKDRIIHAILGLLLALGAWTLLNTINPNLLNANLASLVNREVKVTLASETETPASAVTGGDTFTGPTPSCAEGIKRSASGAYLCSSIADKYDQMINAAKNASLNIAGGGYRSIERQKALRAQNCNGDLTNPSTPCNPPTAVPGASRHNNGLAVDLRCNGTLIQTSDNTCFLWLKANAGDYGLRNLSSEPWHWSIDGR